MSEFPAEESKWRGLVHRVEVGRMGHSLPEAVEFTDDPGRAGSAGLHAKHDGRRTTRGRGRPASIGRGAASRSDSVSETRRDSRAERPRERGVIIKKNYERNFHACNTVGALEGRAAIQQRI